MKIPVRRSCISLIVLSALVEAIRANENETSTTEHRQGRGRIVKLYSGYKPDPVLCTEEGFKADPVVCSVFYRCTKSSSGKFTIFKFQCGPGTVYDPETEVCNHPSSTKRLECGGIKAHVDQDNDNEIEQPELPSPISTIVPIYTGHASNGTSYTTYKVPSLDSSDKFKQSTENGYINPFTISPTPYHEETTKGQIQISTTANFLILEKRQPCTSDGFMGDNENCKKFYRCVSNLRGGYIRYEFECSEPTVWDDHLQSCNHPWAVRSRRCGRAGISYENHTETYPNSEKSTEDLDKRFGAKLPPNSNEDNGDFNKISSNYGDRLNNVDNKYSTEKEQINYESHFNQPSMSNKDTNVETDANLFHYDDTSNNYGQKITEPATNSSTYSEIGSKFSCTRSGFVGDPSDCKKFYRCIENGKGSFTKYDFTCSQGTVWDKKVEACNYAWAVKECGSTSENNNLLSTDGNPSISASSLSENIDSGYINQNNQEHEPPTTVTISTTVTLTSTTNSNQSPKPENLPENNDYSNTYGSQQYATSSKPDIEVVKTTLSPLTNQRSDCKTTGFIGDDNDCKKFYRCVDNGRGGFIKHEFSCGEGTVWDPEIEACNHAWAVKHCGSSIPSKDASSSIANTPSFVSPNIDLGMSTTISSIKTSTPQREINEYDSGYGQQQGISSKKPDFYIETTTLKQIQDQTHNNCQQSGFIGDTNDCKTFYRCVDNGNGGFIKHEFTCGEGTVWDPDIEACNHASVVKHCGGSVPPKENILTSSTPNINVEDPHNGYITDNYIENEDTTPKTTTTTTRFPPTNTVTEKSEITSSLSDTYSSSTTIRTQSTSISNEITKTNNDCDSSGFMGDNNDCQKFYRCVDNGHGGFIKYEFMCGEGTVWDSKIEACNHKWAVEKCGGNLHSHEVERTTTTASHSASPVTESEVNKATSTHSVTYSSSSTTSISTTPKSTTKQPSIENMECNSEGYFANPHDCTKFYRCVSEGESGYTKYEFSCAEGTAWDENTVSCNYINEVKACHSNQPPNTNTTTTKPVYDDQITESDTTKTTSTSSPTTESTSTTAPASATSTTTTTTSTTTTTTNKPKPAEQNTCKEEGYFGDTRDCKKFYRCVAETDGKLTKYDFDCGDGTIWDQDIVTCNHPRDVKSPSCKSESQSTSPASTTWSSTTNSETPITNKPSTTTTRKPSSTSTREPSSTTREPSSTTTDKPISTSTTSEVPSNKNETNSNCTTENDNKNFTCTKAGFYADPSNCKKFYRCVDWENDGKKFSIYHFECSEGTIWDPALETCNHEESVYPPRNCNRTESSSTTTTSSTTEKPTTQSTTTKNPTTQSSTTEKSTTQSSTTQKTTAPTSTTQESTTQSSTTQETTAPTSTTQESTTQSSTTGESTTHSSTTEESTTQSSTTQSSTTEESTTQSSTTEESTTQSSTTQSSTTDESTTQSSTTEESTTQSSTTQSSTTDESTTQSSTTEESTTQSSTTQSSTTEESTTQSSTTQSSTTEESTTQSSTTEESTTQSSTTQSSTTEESTTQSSTTEESVNN